MATWMSSGAVLSLLLSLRFLLRLVDRALFAVAKRLGGAGFFGNGKLRFCLQGRANSASAAAGTYPLGYRHSHKLLWTTRLVPRRPWDLALISS